MDEFVFLDTETTGLNVLTDKIFQLCYMHKGELYDSYFKPQVPISVKAQSITHITNEMVEDKESFSESQMKKNLQVLLSDHILVAHNAIFDVSMLAAEEVEAPRFIDTLKVARVLDPDNVIPEYNLQYLRYYLKLDIKGTAHEARDDVIVLEALFQRLYTKMMEKHQDHKLVVDEMLRISLEPITYFMIPFGKYRGMKIDEIVISDKPYLEWLLEQKLQSPENEEDWIHTLRFHLKITS